MAVNSPAGSSPVVLLATNMRKEDRGQRTELPTSFLQSKDALMG